MLAKKNIKAVAILLSCVLLLGIGVKPVHAEELDMGTVNSIEMNTNAADNESKETTPTVSNKFTTNTGSDTIPNPELDDLVDKVEHKTTEVVLAMQKILSSLCIVVFLIGAAKALFGSIGRKGNWVGGIVTMVLSGVSYVCITYAAEIIAWFSLWISTF